jgi:dephospho-CoA kinase
VYLVGLTGGIAAGKSTVAKRLVELGAIEIDADVLAKEAVAAGSDGLQAIVEHWGPSILTADGELDRAEMAKIIFKDPKQRQLLEEIVHPAVAARSREMILSAGSDSIVIYNVPLLVEAGVSLPFDIVVTVEAPKSAQIDRMIKQRGMTQEEAEARIAAQASPAQRAQRSEIILNSNQSLGRLLDDTDSLWRKLQSAALEKSQRAQA